MRTAPIQTGTSPKPTGGSYEGSSWILKANTKYVFLLTNTTAAENNHFILLKWGEDIHKEA